MLNIKLPTPVYLDTQLRELTEKSGRTFEELESLMFGMTALFLADNGECEIITTMTVDDESVAHLAFDEKSGAYLYGADAVKHLISKNSDGEIVEPISEINISLDVFQKVNSARTWFDICSLAGRVENRARRIVKLKGMNAPLLIMFNENRMLYESVCALEHNWIADKRRAPLTYADGKVLASLNTVGYSLVNGWRDEMTPEERLIRAIFGSAPQGHGA